MRKFRKAIRAGFLVLTLGALSGCSAAAFLLSGCGGEDADLIFYNDSSQCVGSVEIHLSRESQGTACAKEGEGLERGESWGFALPGEEDQVLIEVFDRYGRALARGRCGWPGQGERLWAVYEGSGSVRFSWGEERGR